MCPLYTVYNYNPPPPLVTGNIGIILVIAFFFQMEKLQLDEGDFPAHAWHDNFLLIFIFYNFYKF
jgi:hypothetical protein